MELEVLVPGRLEFGESLRHSVEHVGDLALGCEHTWANQIHLLVATELSEAWYFVERSCCSHLKLDLAGVGLVLEVSESLRCG